MNLYSLKFEHYSQKDSKIGNLAYIVADNSECIYDYMTNGMVEEIEGHYSINIDDCETNEEHKKRIIEIGGDMYDEEYMLEDLYYGLTLYGWKLLKENIQESDLISLEDVNCLGIKVLFLI